MLHHRLKLLAIFGCVWTLCRPAFPAGLQDHSTTQQEAAAPQRDLFKLSLEDLTHIDVSSVSRKSQELFKTPAAVFVIKHEDIQAAGVSSLPELFRMVPGMQVAQISANTWAVSARGFNGRYADKVLVLIDARSVYSMIYSGVFWDQNDIPLDDIDHIEVIRGPGGTLWGANAVNGVINIITRSAKETLGTKVVTSAGNRVNGATIRHGGEIGEKFQYRAVVKCLVRSALRADDGTSGEDAGQSCSVTGRGDLQATTNDRMIFQGNFFRGSESQRIVAFTPNPNAGYVGDSVSVMGGFGLARWEHHSSGSDFGLQGYYTDENRGELGGAGREHVLDLDFQHHLPSFHRNDVVWGLGYRLNTDRIFHNPAAFSSDHHVSTTYSLFFEDDYALVPEKLVVTGGFKLQHNSYTGAELQPGGRVLWTPDAHHSVWASVAKAVRTPSVEDRDLHLFESVPPVNGLPTEALALGNPNFKSEVVVAYEAGYRQTLGENAWLDVATFANNYTRLRNEATLTPYVVTSPTPTLIIPVMYENDYVAKTHGVELAASWKPEKSLHFQLGYTWLNGRLNVLPGPPSVPGDTFSSPNRTVSFRSGWTFAHHWTLDSSLYSVSRLERVSPNGIAPVKAFVRLDQHLSFNLLESLRFSAGVNNILQGEHPEFDPTDGYTVRSQVSRSAFVKAVWSF